MKDILEDIRANTFKPVYLLYGEEDFLVHQLQGKLLHALLPEEDTMNFTRYAGKDTSPGEVIDQAQTLPFFAERRVILLEETGFFKNACPEIAEYLSELPDYLCLLFREKEVDKRQKTYKAAAKAGRTVECKQQDEKALTRWILGMLKKEDKNIRQSDMELFIQKTGPSMENIYQELQKLISYTEGRNVITAKDIDDICSVQLSNKIFDMIRAVTEKNINKALELYYDLLALREPPMRILFLLARQYNQMLQVKDLAALGYDDRSIASMAGIQPFLVKNYRRYAQRYSAAELRQAVEDFTDAEERVKTGRLQDRLSVELMMMKYGGGG